MEKRYDVAVIGTGPAGMFAALELVDGKSGVSVIMLEKGRLRPAVGETDVLSGWGGAGAFSDGKLNLTSAVGGTLHEVIGRELYDEIMPYIDSRYLYFGGHPHSLVDAGRDPRQADWVEGLKTEALAAGLDLRPFPIRHLGSDTAHTIVEQIRRYLLSRGVEIRAECPVDRIEPDESGGWKLAIEHDARIEKPESPPVPGLEYLHGPETEWIRADFVLAVPGRSGAQWLAAQARRLGLKMRNNGVDIGVRVEVKNETLRLIAAVLYEAKLIYRTRRTDDKVRTFCMCPAGFVVTEDYHGLKTVNGHSNGRDGPQSPNTNFAVLVTQMLTEPCDDPHKYGRHISETTNDLAGGGVLVQRLGDLRNGRRSKIEKLPDWVVRPTLLPPAAIPGDLKLAIPARHLEDVVEMLEAMDKIAPGVASDHTLLYGAEVKFYSLKIETSEGFETAAPGLYVAGDGSGYTRGLMQSSMMGVVAARHIAGRITGDRPAAAVSDEDREWERSLDERFEKIQVEQPPRPSGGGCGGH